MENNRKMILTSKQMVPLLMKFRKPGKHTDSLFGLCFVCVVSVKTPTSAANQ